MSCLHGHAGRHGVAVVWFMCVYEEKIGPVAKTQLVSVTPSMLNHSVPHVKWMRPTDLILTSALLENRG